jgi:hypothetical protein
MSDTSRKILGGKPKGRKFKVTWQDDFVKQYRKDYYEHLMKWFEWVEELKKTAADKKKTNV